jgi:hypothetical protein
MIAVGVLAVAALCCLMIQSPEVHVVEFENNIAATALGNI